MNKILLKMLFVYKCNNKYCLFVLLSFARYSFHAFLKAFYQLCTIPTLCKASLFCLCNIGTSFCCLFRLSCNLIFLFNFLGFHGERHLGIECSSGVASKVDRYGLPMY